MMHVFINALAASAGGGLTYIRNVLPRLAAYPDLRVTVVLGPGLRAEFCDLPRIDYVEMGNPPARRFWYEQSVLPDVIRRAQSDVLLSTGNFALRKSPVPQILLSRNSIYTSADFYRDLLARGEYRMWLDTRIRGAMAKRSVGWATVTVAPSEAFAEDLRRWTGGRVLAIHHGFDHDVFVRDSTPLPSEVEGKLRAVAGAFTILFVSHYNYYRNFETLIRALPFLRERMGGVPIKMLLTCRLIPGANPGGYRPHAAAELVKNLGVSDLVEELGPIPYHQLHQVYGRANVYVSPAYTETFAHPLVEAMASKLPVVASDLPVHREICGDAAAYFPRFSPEALAGSVAQVAQSPELSGRMSALGLERSRQFSWKTHVEQILELSERLIKSKARGSLAANDEERGLSPRRSA